MLLCTGSSVPPLLLAGFRYFRVNFKRTGDKAGVLYGLPSAS